ncbi:MAG: anti-sigma F factor [Ruminococcus sp.]|nr:anti-sigma F factor [Ruminococcus sp.]MCM1479571.1 anti-sigma F factor [Muribaculaceae bacterium]
MKIINEIKCVFPANSMNESLARSLISAFSAQLDPTAGEIGEIKTAVSEAVTNCIVHGYRGRTNGSIELVGRILEGGVLYIKVRDKGCGIADVKQAMEPLYTSAPEEERAGLGFAVMESFMDKVTVRSSPNKGTSVIMTRKILPISERQE